MKSRLADSMRRSFPYRNLGRRILAPTLLAVTVTGAAAAQSAAAVSPAAARTAIQAGYAEWAKARLTLDMNTIERMLAPDFYFQTSDRKYTRQEFIDRVPSLRITRFDETVLTVEPKDNDWSAVISAKVEIDTKDKDGKTGKEYRVLVARDAWRKLNDNQWILLSSEPLSQQRWKDQRPPIANW
ncbi:MAG: nuclear transport factor 2 family protein [Gemmatimonadaceae bacterium]